MCMCYRQMRASYAEMEMALDILAWGGFVLTTEQFTLARLITHEEAIGLLERQVCGICLCSFAMHDVFVSL